MPETFESSTAPLERGPHLKTTMAGQQRIKSRKARSDISIMETNNSSIVSKRSVERFYYQEPHFYRYFAKKPQRRSPLINRGLRRNLSYSQYKECIRPLTNLHAQVGTGFVCMPLNKS